MTLKKSLLLATSVSMVLASCATFPSNQGQIPVTEASFTENNLELQDDGIEPYRSLRVEDNAFQIQGGVDSARRAVLVKIGTTEFTLTYNFMAKLRELLAATIDPDRTGPLGTVTNPYSLAVNRGVATTGFFTRLKANAGVTTAASKPAASDTAAYLSDYTLTASEKSFVAKLEAYSSVDIPNFLKNDDNTAASGTDTNALGGTTDPTKINATNYTDRIVFIVNKTGVSNAFYSKVNDALKQDATSSLAAGGLNLTAATDDHVLYAEQISTATTAANFTGAGAAATGSLFKATPAISTAEKNFLTSLVKAGPLVKGVVLLSGSSIVSGDVAVEFGPSDLPAGAGVGATFADFAELAGIASPNALAPITANNTPDGLSAANKKTAVQPAATANMSGAAAVLTASLAVKTPTVTDNLVQGLASVQAPVTTGTGLWFNFSPPADTSLDAYNALSFANWHQAVRSLHMYAGGATGTAAPAASLALTGLVAPAALPAATIKSSNPDATSKEFTKTKNLFEALEYVFGATKVYKLAKASDATSAFKNKAAIEHFFLAPDPAVAGGTLADTNASKRALIVPVTRSVNATSGEVTLKLSASSPTFAVITATAAGNTYADLTFYLSDPSGKPLQDLAGTQPGAYYQMASDGLGALISGTTGIEGYTGTLVGVSN